MGVGIINVEVGESVGSDVCDAKVVIGVISCEVRVIHLYQSAKGGQ